MDGWMDGWMYGGVRVRACVHGWISLFSLPHDVAEILLTGTLSINGINQSDGWMYVRISLYKPFLFGLMDMRIYVSTTGVRMDKFMYGCMYVQLFVWMDGYTKNVFMSLA